MMDRDRFCDLWGRSGGGQEANRLFQALSEKYLEPHRHYHTGEHIVRCLSRYDLATEVMGQNDIVELAIWFHDAILEIGSSDNEQLSVNWFVEIAGDSLPQNSVSSVSRAILATRYQELAPDVEAQFVMDVDLSGFGQSWNAFFADTCLLRQEAAHLDDAGFRNGLEKFLGGLLSWPSVFRTEYFQDQYETNAQQNIHQLLEKLKQSDLWA